jgi:hypothetical protein
VADPKDPNQPTAEELKLQQEAQKVLNDLKREGKVIDQDTAEAIARGNIERQKASQINQDNINQLAAQRHTLSEINETEKNRSVRRARDLEIEELLKKEQKAQLRLLEQQLDKMVASGDAMGEEYQLLKKQVMEGKRKNKLEEINNLQKTKGVEIQKSIVNGMSKSLLNQSKMGKAIGGGIDGMFKFAKGAKMLNNALKAGAISAGMLTAALGIGIILLVVGAIAKLVEWTIGLAIKTRDATVAFQRATGAAKEFGAVIPNVEREMRAVGVSMEEASAAQMALYTSTTDYTMASAGARKDLLKTTALMGEFGVSVETSAKIAQAATKGLGIGIGGADELLLGLSAHASDIGVPINKMAEDFAGVSNELKRFGRDGERVFKRLAMVQKITGIEMGRILSITEKFDTFEGAAKQAGMLNAAIGGNMVNAMDLMMTTDPVDRFNMIRDSILDAAGSFDDMSYYQKKFYANAAGLKDVGELAAMMSGDMGALDGNIGMTSKKFAEQREKAKSWQSTMEILKNTLAAFAPTMTKLAAKLQPVLERFMDGEGRLAKFGDEFGRVMEDALIPFMDELAKADGPIAKLWGFFEDAPATMAKVGEALKAIGIALGIVAGIIIAVSLPAWAVVAVFAAIGGAIWYVMSIFKKKASPSFLDLFTGGVLEKGMKAVGSAIKLLATPIEFIGGLLKKLGMWFSETFNFDSIKEKVSGFVKWLPGEWAEGVMGIKTEMEISSPSKKMEREVMDPTFVQPMQSVAAKMPGLVDDVYADVPERAAENLKPLTATPQKPAAGMEGVARVLQKSFDQTLFGRMQAAFEGRTPEAPTATAGGGSQTTQVNIPITIGKEQLGTVVTEIVDGRLGAVSYQGMASTTGI